MDLSILIVTYNSARLIGSLLDRLQAELADLAAEVVIVDNASRDGTADRVRREHPWANLVASSENLGFAAGNNVALRLARGRHVLLLNTDTLVHGSVLPDAVAWLDSNPGTGVLGPQVLNSDGTVQASCSSFPSLGNLLLQTLGVTRVARWDGYRMTGWDRSEARPVDVISGAAMFVRRSAMEEVGLLDEAFFFYGEETDWCRRFGQAGWEAMYVPLPAITHFGGGSVRSLNHRRDVLLTEATIRLHRKHGGRLAGLACFVILAAHNLSRAAFWTLPAVTGRPGARKRAAHFARVSLDLPRTWPAVREGVR
jgi:GT2 family glycosyltransferase